MNYLDIIISVLLLLFAIKGYRNGIIRETFSLAAFIIGIFGAIKLSNVVGEKLSTMIELSPEVLSIISFILVFIILTIIIDLIGKIISNLVKALSLGFIDKIGGFLLGVAKGFLIIGILINTLGFFGLKDSIAKETREKSALYKTAEDVADWLYENKGIWMEKLEEGYEQTEEYLENIL
ncbi:MAG: CvpA family protein [Candidatus Limimorpha sp.]